jgi:hypothetical protein
VTDPGAPLPPPQGTVPAAPSRLPLALTLLALAVALVGCASLLLYGGSGTGATATPPASSLAATPSLSPASSPGATATAAPGSATPGSSGLSDPALVAAVEAVEAQVPALRGLQPLRAVPSRVIGEAQLVTELAQRFREENPHARIAAQGAFLARLGLLPAGTDLEALEEELLGSQVIGFYDDTIKTLSIVQRGGAFGPLERTTVAHEFTHALQDQHFDLAKLGTDDPSNGDRASARLALAEGDASLLMGLWSYQHLSAAEQAELVRESSDPAQLALLARMPPFLVQQLLFPYQQGAAFVGRLYGSGGWGAVDAAYARPPDSSAQILHPELYASGLEPLAVDVGATNLARALDAAAGAGWRATYEDTLGEFTLGQWLTRGVGADAAASVAGWRGDRAVYLQGPGGHWYLVLKTAFEDAVAAATFSAAAQASAAGLAPQVAVRTSADGKTVTVTLADVPLLSGS